MLHTVGSSAQNHRQVQRRCATAPSPLSHSPSNQPSSERLKNSDVSVNGNDAKKVVEDVVEDAVEDVVEKVVEKLNDRQNRILEAIKNHPAVSASIMDETATDNRLHDPNFWIFLTFIGQQ